MSTHYPGHIRPRAIQIEASSFCQLRCPTCPTATGAIDAAIGRGFLTADHLRRLLDSAPNIRQIELSNFGEIFLNPELLDLLRICDERQVAATAINGVNLNNARPEMLEGVVRYRMRVMTVSIDGATSETYARYRVRGRLDTVLANVLRINAYKLRLGSDFPRLRWQFVVFGHNEHEIEDARALAATLGMEFAPKLSWDDALSPVRDPDAVRRVIPQQAATREELRERTGRDYVGGACHQLWDSPQVNWDGKMLGCCINHWGDFGANAFDDGFDAAVNSDGMTYGRAMVRGLAEPRAGIPCTTCDIYKGMQETGNWLERDDLARGQTLAPDEAVALAATLRDQGRTRDAAAVCRRVLAAEPGHGGAMRLLFELDRA